MPQLLHSGRVPPLSLPRGEFFAAESFASGLALAGVVPVSERDVPDPRMWSGNACRRPLLRWFAAATPEGAP